MAEQDPGQNSRTTLAGQLPDPPPFWKSFTPENINRLKKLQEKTPVSSPGENVSAIPLKDLPNDLICLQPPAEPHNGQWRVFGDMYTLDAKLPTLEEQGMDQLVAPPDGMKNNKDVKHLDRAFELKRLSKSILLNFLELMGQMSLDPAFAADKVNDMNILFINFHHVLNEYRPHQAREQAISLMQDRLDKIRAETTAINAQVDKAKRVLDGLASIEVPYVETTIKLKSSSAVEHQELKRRREHEVWRQADMLIIPI